jgi:hypothetical protein
MKDRMTFEERRQLVRETQETLSLCVQLRRFKGFTASEEITLDLMIANHESRLRLLTRVDPPPTWDEFNECLTPVADLVL